MLQKRFGRNEIIPSVHPTSCMNLLSQALYISLCTSDD